MKLTRYAVCLILAVFMGGSFLGCKPKMGMMSELGEHFIKKVDKTACKLDLNGDQKIQLEKLKLDIKKNFDEGQIEQKETWLKIKEDAAKENPDIGKMTSLLQEMLLNETKRINRAFDLVLDFRKNLNEDQKKKLGRMISERVKEWD